MSTDATVAATVVPAAVAVAPFELVAPDAVLSAANVTVAASPTLTDPTSDSDTDAGTTMLVRSDNVMNPLLVLVFEDDDVDDEEEFDAADVELDDVEPVLAPVEEPPDELLLEDATDPDAGAEPTAPFTVITVAAIGDVSVQSATAAWALDNAVCAVVTAVAFWVVDDCACVSAVCALATLC